MRDLLYSAEVGDFVIGDNGRIYQVSDCEMCEVGAYQMKEMLLTRIANDRLRLVSFTSAISETVDIYKPCPVCCGDGDSKDVDCPTCDSIGFIWES